MLNSPDSAVARAAAVALQTLAGIDSEKAHWDAWDAKGFDAMTKPQQYVHAVRDYKNEVDNGGHWQYFHNSNSDVYHTAIDGLRAIGATSKIAILNDALQAFQPFVPAPNWQHRRDQMDEFTDEQNVTFQEADRKFYASENRAGERLDVLLALYALDHKSEFTPRP